MIHFVLSRANTWLLYDVIFQKYPHLVKNHLFVGEIWSYKLLLICKALCFSHHKFMIWSFRCCNCGQHTTCRPTNTIFSLILHMISEISTETASKALIVKFHISMRSHFCYSTAFKLFMTLFTLLTMLKSQWQPFQQENMYYVWFIHL